MKWVTVNRTHVNPNNVDCFFWDDDTGELVIWYNGDQTPVVYKDPNRLLYIRLCEQLGVQPVMEDRHG